MRDKKGFTLIELLAVIIILGVLMLIAIPSVTEYISSSRKSGYINTAREIISGAVALVNEGELEIFDVDTTYYINSKCINTENSQRTPYGEFDKAYVVVTYNGFGYNYYWASVDVTGHGVKNITPENELDESLIESGIKAFDISEKKKLEDNTKYIIIDENCNKGELQDIVSVCKLKKDRKITIELADSNVQLNKKSDLIAKFYGYEDCEYTVEWQYSIDDKNFITIDPTIHPDFSISDDGKVLTVFVTSENYLYYFRVLARIDSDVEYID